MKAVVTFSGELPETHAQHRKAVVLRDDDWEEFRVRFYVGGKHQRKADYHSSSESDARATAAHWIGQEPDDTPAPVAPQGEPGTRDMTPTWTDVLGVYLAVLEDGNDQGKAIARQELRRMAAAADNWNSRNR